MKIFRLKDTIALMRPFTVMALLASPSCLAHARQSMPDTTLHRENALRIFIDCASCDMDYIREQVPYVNYVRDVKEAQVYVQETRDRTGSGGNRYTILFAGQQEFSGINDTLVYSSRPDDPDDVVRKGRTQILKMGLMPYVARTQHFSEVEISASEQVGQRHVEDRWNNWVFEIEAEPDFEGEETLSELELSSSLSAVKITDDWKFELDFHNRFSRTKYNYEDTLYTEDVSTQFFDNLIVRSLGEHWSAGMYSEFYSSTYRNTIYSIDLFPSAEYNIFPYAESTHRQLRILYSLGVTFNAYYDTTIYNHLRENRMRQKLQAAYEVQQKWGSVNIHLEESNYFYDLSKNRIELGGHIEVRIVKGLSVFLYGGAARINDQLSLPRGELTEADILLHLQELKTSYELDGGIGITYTFGSIYNNIVNPRFGN